MSDLRTDYKGYSIFYSENSDEWTSFDAGDHMSAPTLSKMKEKIDRLALSIRKASSTPCYEIQTGNGEFVLSLVDSTVIEYLGPRVERSWSGSKPDVIKHKIAIVGQRRGSERAARRETEITHVSPRTAEVEALVDEANRLGQIAQHAKKAFEAAKARVPTMTIDMIPDLIKVSGIDPNPVKK